MQPLVSRTELIGILEHGLIHGYWSIDEFNASAQIPIYPTVQFLHEHPRFTVINFRDLDAYFAARQRSVRL